MAYNNQQQQPAPQPKAKLSQAELEEISKFTQREGWLAFPPEDIELMYEAFPDGTATMVLPEEYRKPDFKRFVRMASVKKLDPLLGDLLWEYRSNNKSPTGMTGRPMLPQQAELKIAHRSGLDGIDQEDKSDERGFYIKTSVYKQGCKHPFTYKAYQQEYAKIGGFTWKDMPFLMLSKCSRVGALRIAFPEELAGLPSEEETFIDHDSASYAPPASSSSSSSALTINEKKDEPTPTPDPTPTPATPTAEPSRSGQAPPAPAPQAQTQATQGTKPEPIKTETDKPDHSAAFKTRLTVLSGNNSAYAKDGVTTPKVHEFLASYFSVTVPKLREVDPALFAPVLDDLIVQLSEGAVKRFVEDPVKFGQYRKLAKPVAAKPASTADDSLWTNALKQRFGWSSADLLRNAAVFMSKYREDGFKTVDDLKNILLDPAGLSALNEPQLEIAFSVGYYGADALSLLMKCFQDTQTPLSQLKADAEKACGRLDSWTLDAAKVYEAIRAAVNKATPPKKPAFGMRA